MMRHQALLFVITVLLGMAGICWAAQPEGNSGGGAHELLGLTRVPESITGQSPEKISIQCVDANGRKLKPGASGAARCSGEMRSPGGDSAVQVGSGSVGVSVRSP